MKYSFMSFSTPDLDLKETLSLALKLGYDAVEPRIDAGHKHGIELSSSVEDRKVLKETIAESEIDIACLATSIGLVDAAKGKASSDKLLRNILDCLELAESVGAPALRIFGGDLPENMDHEMCISEITEFFTTKLIPQVLDSPLALYLETHDHWTNPHHVAQLVEAVNWKGLQVNWDFMHTVGKGETSHPNSFDLFKENLAHVHVHDSQAEPFKWLPIGEGEVEHLEPMRLLLENDYHGYISGEWIDWKDPDHLSREIKTLKKMERSLSNV